ncbi:hypothetical protein RND71_031000 [Anisodus tanguticus]|uniref:Uncharacterized protein n=1 Tax=Anisodus tanguticus TaxID=243964 RepID=A0AAE1RIQ1_9SOLA|nr:hypothetical protein RND71_031000 [Anisodus tanguticus]
MSLLKSLPDSYFIRHVEISESAFGWIYFSKLRPTFLLQKVQNQVLIIYTNQLFEKEDSGCRALLRQEKRQRCVC